MKGMNLIKRMLAAALAEPTEASYAQAGEDRILDFLFSLLSIDKPTYLDIGAHHPSYLSNTYLFYKRGSRGVCVEPDPALMAGIQRKRNGDVCLNIGIAVGDAQRLEFYIFDDPTMNTFSSQVRDEQITCGRVLVKTLEIEVQGINEVISRHFEGVPDLVSLDTEGMDLPILKSLNFATFRPPVLCVETLGNAVERKLSEIIDFVVSQRYRVYADTYVNTIFVNEDSWQARPAISSMK